MVFICWGIFKYHTALAKTGKKNSHCSNRLIASNVIFNKLWAKLYSQHLSAMLIVGPINTWDKL